MWSHQARAISNTHNNFLLNEETLIIYYIKKNKERKYIDFDVVFYYIYIIDFGILSLYRLYSSFGQDLKSYIISHASQPFFISVTLLDSYSHKLFLAAERRASNLVI